MNHPPRGCHVYDPTRIFDGPLADVLRAVDQASQLAGWIRQHSIVALQKRDRAPLLTIADLAAQAVVAHALERTFPNDPVIAEEDGAVLESAVGRALVEPLLHFLRPLLPALTTRELARLLDRGKGPRGPRFWVLDPVDGTEGYLRDGHHYVVALALIEHGKPTVGILGCPTLEGGGLPDPSLAPFKAHGSLVVGRRGVGTWASPLDTADFSPVRVSDTTSLHAAQMLQSFVDTHMDVGATRAFVHAAGIASPPRSLDSQAKHVLIAMGHADIFLRIPADASYKEHLWDHAAGALAIEEAGGCVTDLEGRPLDFSAGSRLIRNDGVIASNGHLHGRAVAAVRAARASVAPAPPAVASMAAHAGSPGASSC